MTTVVETDDQILALEAELKEAIERAETAEARVEELKPTRSIEHYLDMSEEGLRARFGEQQIRDIAARELVQINKRRLAEGLTPVSWEGRELEDAIQRVIAGLQADRQLYGPPSEGPLNKTLKMVKPDDMLIQVPYENQINNLAGSIEDAVARYRNKGYKLTEPLLCPSQNCWEKAAMNGGVYEFKGYCTEDHMKRTERTR